MRTGRLRHRLVIQSKTSSRDAYGADLVTWGTVATVWGAIEPLSQKELFAQNQIQPEAQVRIVLRYRSGIDTTYRISNGGKYYNIVSIINENERDRTLTLLCRQGVSEDRGGDSDTFFVVNSGTYVVNSGIQVINT